MGSCEEIPEPLSSSLGCYEGSVGAPGEPQSIFLPGSPTSGHPWKSTEQCVMWSHLARDEPELGQGQDEEDGGEKAACPAVLLVAHVSMKGAIPLVEETPEPSQCFLNSLEEPSSNPLTPRASRLQQPASNPGNPPEHLCYPASRDVTGGVSRMCLFAFQKEVVFREKILPRLNGWAGDPGLFLQGHNREITPKPLARSSGPVLNPLWGNGANSVWPKEGGRLSKQHIWECDHAALATLWDNIALLSSYPGPAAW